MDGWMFRSLIFFQASEICMCYQAREGANDP